MSDKLRTAWAAIKCGLGLGPRVIYYLGKPYPMTVDGQLARLRATIAKCAQDCLDGKPKSVEIDFDHLT